MNRAMKYALTAKQRANIAQQRKVPYLLGPTRSSGIPPTSWWIGVDRATFTATAKTERLRMAQSRFARATDPTYGGGV